MAYSGVQAWDTREDNPQTLVTVIMILGREETYSGTSMAQILSPLSVMLPVVAAIRLSSNHLQPDCQPQKPGILFSIPLLSSSSSYCIH